MSALTVLDLTLALATDRAAHARHAPHAGARRAATMVVLAGFAFTGAVLAALTPAGAGAAAAVSALFTGTMVTGFVRNLRAGVVLALAQAAFAAVMLVAGPALAVAVRRG